MDNPHLLPGPSPPPSSSGWLAYNLELSSFRRTTSGSKRQKIDWQKMRMKPDWNGYSARVKEGLVVLNRVRVLGAGPHLPIQGYIKYPPPPPRVHRRAFVILFWKRIYCIQIPSCDMGSHVRSENSSSGHLQEVKNNRKLLDHQPQIVVAVAYRRWSFTRGSNCKT